MNNNVCAWLIAILLFLYCSNSVAAEIWEHEVHYKPGNLRITLEDREIHKAKLIYTFGKIHYSMDFLKNQGVFSVSFPTRSDQLVYKIRILNSSGRHESPPQVYSLSSNLEAHQELSELKSENEESERKIRQLQNAIARLEMASAKTLGRHVAKELVKASERERQKQEEFEASKTRAREEMQKMSQILEKTGRGKRVRKARELLEVQGELAWRTKGS